MDGAAVSCCWLHRGKELIRLDRMGKRGRILENFNANYILVWLFVDSVLAIIVWRISPRDNRSIQLDLSCLPSPSYLPPSTHLALLLMFSFLSSFSLLPRSHPYKIPFLHSPTHFSPYLFRGAASLVTSTHFQDQGFGKDNYIVNITAICSTSTLRSFLVLSSENYHLHRAVRFFHKTSLRFITFILSPFLFFFPFTLGEIPCLQSM